MIKVVWLIKRAEGLSFEDFKTWWLDRHIPMVVAAQKPYLKRYEINIGWPRDTLPGKPAVECEWDGTAEMWFDSEADFRAVYDQPVISTRADTLAHTSRQQRMIVEEFKIDVRGGTAVRS
jgi:uncharacterized protein (TIGR02118 family)